MTNAPALALSTVASISTAVPTAVELGLMAPPQTAAPSDQQVLTHLAEHARFDDEGECYVLGSPADVIHAAWPYLDVTAFYARMAASVTAQWRVVGRGGAARRRFYLLTVEPRVVLDDDTAGAAPIGESSAPSVPTAAEAQAAVDTAAASAFDHVGGTLCLTLEERKLFGALSYRNPPYRRGEWSPANAQAWTREEIGIALEHESPVIVDEVLGRFRKEGIVVREGDVYRLAVDPTRVGIVHVAGERPIYLVSHATAKQIEAARGFVATAARKHGGSIPAAELPGLYRKVAQAWRTTPHYVSTLLAGDSSVRAARSACEMLRHQPDGSAVLVSPHLAWCDLLIESEGNPGVRNGQSVRITTATKGYGSASRRVFDRYRF